ncbi:MAG TPA: hypothetical protein VFR49_01170, partial [Solirubrobacteraceae bacterium]|nr:hypothetical protein [Solirubrobacteraceae bacterium]
ITNPRTGATDTVTQHIADRTTQDILHMDNTDPLRTPSFTLFGNPDYFFQSSCATGSDPNQPGCPIVGPGFAWNHGDDNPEIARTWIGLVGPDVNTLGQTPSVWTDHTDVRPTMLAALGLRDDYADDGNVVSQVLTSSVLPPAIQGHQASYQALEAVQKQLNAPFGQFGHDAETVSTTAVASTDGPTYAAWDAQLAACRTARDGVAARIQSTLAGAAAGAGPLDEATTAGLAADASALIGDMHALAAQTTPPAGTLCDAPTVTITAHPSDPSKATSATFAFATSDPAHPGATLTTTCSLDGATGAPCTSPVTYSHLADGAHTFKVAAGDQAGNVGSASFTFTVDTTRPTCATVRIERGHPRRALVGVQDAGSGLASITNTRARNGTIDVAPFEAGTTQPVLVTVTKTHESWLAALLFDLTGISLDPTIWSFDASDGAGNTVHCAGRFG